MPTTSQTQFVFVDGTVTSKGQITLPSELRKRPGLRQGSRIRFSMSSTTDN